MKMRLNLKRLLPVLLSLVLLIGLLPLSAVTASASGNSFAYAYDCQRSGDTWPEQGHSFTATGISDPYNSSRQRIEPAGTWVLTPKGYWTSGMSSALGAGSYLNPVITNIANSYHIQPEQVMVYELTKGSAHIAYGAIFARSSNADEIATFLGDNWNPSGCTYLLSDSPLSGSKTVTIAQDAASFAPELHTHNWEANTSSPGLQEATTTITCVGTANDPGCGESLTVSLKASDVTLPGNVFNAQIGKTSGAARSRAAQVAANPLTVSQTPDYKYSTNGSGFTPIPDTNSFTPKQGIYQASIVVTDGNVQVANLAVKYTVSDPKVTAATGDERPIEWMLAGLFAFGIMAAAAFTLDGKRKSVR